MVFTWTFEILFLHISERFLPGIRALQIACHWCWCLMPAMRSGRAGGLSWQGQRLGWGAGPVRGLQVALQAGGSGVFTTENQACLLGLPALVLVCTVVRSCGPLHSGCRLSIVESLTLTGVSWMVLTGISQIWWENSVLCTVIVLMRQNHVSVYPKHWAACIRNMGAAPGPTGFLSGQMTCSLLFPDSFNNTALFY